MSEIWDRCSIVGHEDTTLGSHPFVDKRILGAQESNILNADDVEIKFATNQASNEITIQILVAGEPKLSVTPKPCKRPATGDGGRSGCTG